jgi:hypothetical protein
MDALIAGERAGQHVARCQQLAVGAALCAALVAAPAHATALDDAVAEVSDSAYPVLRALKPETFGPFVTKVGDLVLKAVPPAKLSKAVDQGLDYFLSVPPAKVGAVASATKEAFSGLSVDTCVLVPLPPAALFNKFVAADAVAQVDAAKLKSFAEEARGVVSAIPRKGDLACLPPSAALTKAALAQADAAAAADPAAAKAFGKAAGAALKSIPPGQLFPLAGDANQLTRGASLDERQRFKKAGVRIEAVAKRAAAAQAAAPGPAVGEP